jgi:hypothetical protein
MKKKYVYYAMAKLNSKNEKKKWLTRKNEVEFTHYVNCSISF